MKKWMVVAVGVLVALLVLGAAKDLIIKVAVESGTQAVTGLKLGIGTFRVGIINTLVDIRNLRIFNPAGFKDRIMLDMPEIYVDYELIPVFAGKIHLKDVRINMKKFVVVKNSDGKLNLDSLRVVQAQKSGVKPESQAGGKAPQIQIDKLRLKVGKVIYKDYSKGGEPIVTEYDVNIDEEYRDINDPYTLVSLIVVKSLAKTSISRMANFDIYGLKISASDVLSTAQQVTSTTTDTAAQTVSNVNDQVVSKAADVVSDTFKNVFGSGQ